MSGLYASKCSTCQKPGGNYNCKTLRDYCPSCCIYWFGQAILCGTRIEYLPPFPRLSKVANRKDVFSGFQNVCLNTKQFSSSFFWWGMRHHDQKNLLNVCSKSVSLRSKRAYTLPSLEAIQKYTFQFEVSVLLWQNVHMQLVSLNSVLFPRGKDLIGFK